MSVTLSQGWGVLHLYYRLDRTAAPGEFAALTEAVKALRADEHQVVCSNVLGGKADIGVMALGPDLERLHAFQAVLAAGPFAPTSSFVSVTELSPYTSTEDDERARLANEEGIIDEAEVEVRLGPWRERMAHYQQHRLYPQLPPKQVVCFYPMTKRRTAADNWYMLPFDERKRLMGSHARTGRTYAGRVLQLITGSTGFDDWEWGVTLFADDAIVIKDIVHEMRFDEVSARYADFGEFIVGLVGEPDVVLSRAGVA